MTSLAERRFGLQAIPSHHLTRPIRKRKGVSEDEARLRVLKKKKEEEEKPEPPRIWHDENQVDPAEVKKAHAEKEQKAKLFLDLAMKGDLANMYEVYPEEKKEPDPPQLAALFLKDPSQWVVCGKTGAGKTNFTLNLYNVANCYDRVDLIVKDKDEHLYTEFIKELKEEGRRTGKDILKIYNSIRSYPAVKDISDALRAKKERLLVIIDDQVNESARDLKQILDIYIMGRKGGITPMFLTQSFFDTPKVIRKNTSHIALGRLSGEQDMKRIVREFPQLNTTWRDAEQLYKHVMMKYGDMMFLTVDTSANEKGLQFRLNLAPYSLFPKDSSQSNSSSSSSSSSSPSSHEPPEAPPGGRKRVRRDPSHSAEHSTKRRQRGAGWNGFGLDDDDEWTAPIAPPFTDTSREIPHPRKRSSCPPTHVPAPRLPWTSQRGY